MPLSSPTIIGTLCDVTGSKLSARLYSEQDGLQSHIRVGMEEITVGQIGTYVAVRSKGVQILSQIVRMSLNRIDGQDQKELEMLPLGELTQDGQFFRGITHFPIIGAEVHVISTVQLEAMFDRYRRLGLDLGRVSLRDELRVYCDPNNLFSRHMAILGQSGSGKSWTVTSVLQRTIKRMPKSHIILLDLHGEYGWRDDDGVMHSAFPKEIVRHIDARELEIPYWLLTYSELIDLLIDRSDENANIQIAFMREVLYSLRKKANKDLGLSQLSVDSPVYFSLKEMYQQFKKANEQQSEFGKSKGPLFGAFNEFLLRFQAMYNDARYDFLFKPKKRTNSLQLEDLLRDFVGLAEPKRQITVIDLSPIPHDVRPTISAQIGRLAFEFNYWNPKRRDFPIMLVCEEAHQYIPRHENEQNVATRKAMEKIAKEGRKYGVSLCVVSQRPLELSETVLSQCSNFICMRISNPDDQAYIRRLMPDGERDLTEILSTLRRGEALAVGEAIPLPTRFQIYKPDPPPASNDINVSQAWTKGPDDLDVKNIINHWWRQER